MENKRYSIVRVDRSCPLSDINIGNINIGNINVCKISKSCQNCLFGDTKEQLIKKVAQVLFKKFMKTNSRFKGLKKIQIAKRLAYKLAKEIVEFLGVE